MRYGRPEMEARLRQWRDNRHAGLGVVVALTRGTTGVRHSGVIAAGAALATCHASLRRTAPAGAGRELLAAHGSQQCGRSHDANDRHDSLWRRSSPGGKPDARACAKRNSGYSGRSVGLRRLLVIGLAPLFIAAPAAALVCEAGCGTADVPQAATGKTVDDCHRAMHEESGVDSWLVGGHDCNQHAATGTVSLKAEPNRAASSQHLALLASPSSHWDFSPSRDAMSQHDLAPPGSSTRLITPLRI